MLAARLPPEGEQFALGAALRAHSCAPLALRAVPQGGAIRAWGGPARSLVVNAALEKAELRQREEPEYRQQNHGQRRRVRRVLEPEADL